MYKKLVGIVVLTLLITTALPAVGTMNIEKISNTPSKSTSTDIVWSDNFDSYDLGQFLDGTPDDGGWKGFLDDPTVGAYVVDDQAYSLPHSVDIAQGVDLLHEFTGICSGKWTFACWMYIPINYSSSSYFGLISYYRDNMSVDDLRFPVALLFNGASGIVKSHVFGPTLPLVMGQWVEIRVEIDLDADWFQCYYNNELLDEKNWTAGYLNLDDGYFNLNGVDLWNFQVDSVYYDDFSLEGEAGPMPDLACTGKLNWEKVKPGETVNGSFTVENIGDPNSVLDWEFIDWPKDWGTNWTFNPTVGRLKPEDGPVTVEVSVDAPEEEDTEYTGVIKLCAIYDPNKYCEIDVYIKTPRSRETYNTFFQRLFERFPNAFPILRQLLGFL